MADETVYRVGETYKKMDYTIQPMLKGEYEDCSFVDCNFEGVDLATIKFIECQFIGCNLSLAKILNTAFGDVSFTDCKMLGLHFDQCNSFGFSVRFNKCMLDHATFYRVKAKNTSFINTSLKEVDFTETELTNAVFDHCDLLDAKFENTNLEKVDFRTAFNYTIDPQLNRIKKARFSREGVHGLLHKFDVEIY